MQERLGNDLGEPLARLHHVPIISLDFLENPMDLVALLYLFICEEAAEQRGFLTYSGMWWGQDSGIGMSDVEVNTLTGTLNRVQAHTKILTSRVLSQQEQVAFVLNLRALYKYFALHYDCSIYLLY